MLVDRTHISAIGHPNYVRQTTLRDNPNCGEYLARHNNGIGQMVKEVHQIHSYNPDDLEGFFQEVRGCFYCNVLEFLVKMNPPLRVD